MTPWVGIGGIGLVVGGEWENCMALSLYEPEVTLCLILFVSCPVRVCGTPFSFTSLSYHISVSSLVSAARRTALTATEATVLTNIVMYHVSHVMCNKKIPHAGNTRPSCTCVIQEY